MKELVKANTKLMMNSMLAGAVVSIFFLISSLQPQLLKDNPLLALQITVAIPFLITACIVSSYTDETPNSRLWYNFGWFTFIVGYAFTINAIGIILGLITSVALSLIFFACSIILPLVYSFILVQFESKSISERIIRDSIFIALQVILGIGEVLGWFR